MAAGHNQDGVATDLQGVLGGHAQNLAQFVQALDLTGKVPVGFQPLKELPEPPTRAAEEPAACALLHIHRRKHGQ